MTSHGEEEHAIELLRLTGYSLNEAKILYALISNGRLDSIKLRNKTLLKQSTISGAAKRLESANMIQHVRVKNNKPGRPVQQYHLSEHGRRHLHKALRELIDQLTEAKKTLQNKL